MALAFLAMIRSSEEISPGSQRHLDCEFDGEFGGGGKPATW